MRYINLRETIVVLTFVLTVAMPQLAPAAEPSAQVAVRIIVLTESDGTNAAASTKQIAEQLAVLRNDAARHGINVAAGRTQFVADSSLRKLPEAQAARLAKADKTASPSTDEIIVYVTGLTAADKAPAKKYLLLEPNADRRSEPSPRPLPGGEGETHRGQATIGEKNDTEILRVARNNSSATSTSHPAIVIDAKEIGGQGCGPTARPPSAFSRLHWPKRSASLLRRNLSAAAPPR